MELLYFFESIRCGVLDVLMSLITRLGEETLFMAIALCYFWCIDKYQGYYLLSTGLFGTAVNQTLKMIFRIPRPWVLDPNFTIVESAREAATGYSFPSGHTQTAVGVFGSIARGNCGRLLRGVCIALAVLVPLSRMYLGVHTPLDVGVSAAAALVLIFAFYPIVSKAKEKPAYLWGLIGGMFALTAAALVFVMTYAFPADVDAANLLAAKDTLSKLTGALIGMAVVFFADERYTRFDTKASLPAQALKIVLGLLLVVGVQNGLKPVMNALFGESPLRHILRYCVMVIVGGAVWPLTFPLFQKLGKKKEPRT